jgi:phosphoadenosine phosphosulfate reductase
MTAHHPATIAVPVPDRSMHATGGYDVDAIAAALHECEAEDIIRWAAETFAGGLGLTTALGYSGIVLLDLMRRHIDPVHAYFIDTGCHFPETLELKLRIERAWGVDFTVLRADLQGRDDSGISPERIGPDECCRLRKVEPLLRVLDEKDAWLSALRRDQAPTRSTIRAFDVDARGSVKIYPLAGWTRADCWRHIRRHKLPYNPLHDRGYMSIGCAPCTRPTAPGEHERNGRWADSAKVECGLHLTAD